MGHLSVLLGTDRGELFYLADAVYLLRALHEDRLPWRTHDDAQSLESMRQIREYASANPRTELVPCHDPEVWERFARRDEAPA